VRCSNNVIDNCIGGWGGERFDNHCQLEYAGSVAGLY